MALDDFNFSEGGEQAGNSEKSSESIEQYTENQKRTARQAQSDKAQEKKQKEQEDVLAKIIMQFLRNNKYSGLFILLSKTLAKNIPADFLLALLSLIHKDSFDALQVKDIPISKEKERHINTEKNIKSAFPKELSAPMVQWTTLLFSVGSHHPHKVLETILDHNWKLDKNLSQLMSLIILEFFKHKKYSVPFPNILTFSETFLTQLSSDLELQISNQNKLSVSD